MAYKKKCKHCGEEFVPQRDWQKFCSRSHQREYWRKIYNERYVLSERVGELESRIKEIESNK